MKTWHFRDEILRMTGQWQIVLAFILAGGLVGFVGTYLYPAPYRATAELYVGIDVIRVGEMEHVILLEKHEPLNLEDYKNWKLNQVANIVSSPLIVKKTLSELQAEDEYWKQVDAEALMDRMDIYWYDAGDWRLEVVHPQAEYAAQAVDVWRDVSYAHLEELLVHAERATALDAELQSANTSIGIVEERIASLEEGTDLEEAQEALLSLTSKREKILEKYHAALDDSKGLSANIYLESNSEVAQGERVRATGTVTLLSGGIGLLVWVFVALLRARNVEDAYVV